MSAMSIAEALPATLPVSRSATQPVLRRRPLPVTEPRPALRIVRDNDDLTVSGAQQTLSLYIDEPRARAHSTDAGIDVIDAFCAPVTTSSRELPAPRTWAGQFVQAAIEVAAGLRPPGQLVRWTSDDVHAALTRRCALATRIGRVAAPAPARRTVVHSVRVCQPRDGVVEATATTSDGERVRAVALRMEGLDGRWRVTALELG